MAQYVKIGTDIVNLAAITRVSFMDAQSGISDRTLIDVGGAVVVVDSAIGGRARMEAIREKLLQVLDPEDWDAACAKSA